MALSRVKVWSSGEVLYATDLNNEFNNILQNAASLISPLTGAIDLDGYALTIDAAGVTTLTSSAAVALSYTTGAKAGTPGSTGSIANFSAHTFTDSATAGSGTATSYTGFSVQRPTLAATNSSVTTTDAATFYIPNAPAAGTNETITNAWALWVDAGNVRLDGDLTVRSQARAGATVTAHATTMNPWVSDVATLSGSAVTFTDITDAAYVGQRVLLLMNAAHIWTDGAVFDVQGGATYTTAAGDWVEIVATAVDAFDVTIFPALGQPVSMQPITASLSGDVALNNTGTFFDGPSVAQGTAGTWFVSGTVTCHDTAGSAAFSAKLYDGTTTIASSVFSSAGASNAASITLSGYISSPAGNLRIAVKDGTATTGVMLFNLTGLSKDSTITAIRIR